MKAKKSFIIHVDSLDILNDLTEVQAGQLFKAIRGFHLGEEGPVDPLIKMVYLPFKNQFIRDNESYGVFVKTQSDKGKASAELRKKNRTQQKSTAVDLVSSGQPVSTDSTYSVSVSVKDSKKDKKGKLIPFSESDIFDKNRFKEAFPLWSKSKLKYYWESLDAYSEEGNKYINWKTTCKKWAASDALKGELKFPMDEAGADSPYDTNELRIARAQVEAGGGLPDWFKPEYKHLIEN